MKRAALLGCLIATALAACSMAPGKGPSADAITDQHKTGDRVLYDVVKVDNRVLATVLSRPKQGFRETFRAYSKPPRLRIAVGDRIGVAFWEAAAGGLFSGSQHALLTGPKREPLPLSQGGAAGLGVTAEPSESSQQKERSLIEEMLGNTKPSSQGTLPSLSPPGSAGGNQAERSHGGAVPRSLAEAEDNSRGTQLPDQLVMPDGTISVPYAGRVPAAGRTPEEVERTIRKRLKSKALDLQAVVVDKESAANSVAVTGEAVKGARVPLMPGDRLLQVIAAAGGPRAPIDDTLVRLSRGRVTATVPLARLIGDPRENIYAWPGDVLTLVRARKSFSVFGGTGKNAQFHLDSNTATLSEALAKAHWLREDRANPHDVFLFRYEPDHLVRALGQPLATHRIDGVSPVVYRFNLADAKTYFLARRFPVRNKDIIFVAEAKLVPLYKWFAVLSHVIGPIETGLLVCFQAKAC